MNEFSDGQMVRCIENKKEPQYVGAIGQVLAKHPTPPRMRLMAAMALGQDIGNCVYEVKFAGFEAQYCAAETCKEPHYAMCFWFEIEPIINPDEEQEEDRIESLDLEEERVTG